MEISKLKSLLQNHLGDGLVTIVGSGLSCAEGMPGMGDLGTHLKATIPPRISSSDLSIWSSIALEMDASGLEAALLKFPPTLTLETAIIEATVELFLPAEAQIFADVLSGKKTLQLSRLLKHLLKPETGIPIITTNYDRLIEFAAEQVGLGVDTMFVGQYCGVLNEKESRLSFLRDVSIKARVAHYRFREKVQLLKPHGSLDWFHSPNGPIRHSCDTNAPRLIITPGLNKFRNGYESPFDLHRDRANAAIDRATKFLVIGYGFNDDHLETHLRPLINSGKQCVLLTHTLSDKGREFLKTGDKFIGIERSASPLGTRLLMGANETVYPDIHIWNLKDFITEVLEP